MCAALDASLLRQCAYNIAGGTSLTLGAIVQIAAEALPGLRVEFGDDPLSREYCLGAIDQSAAERDLGYVPTLRLGEAIAAYARAMSSEHQGTRSSERTRAAMRG
jgi:nucleoside-diphosphate-sugar epimerase